MRRAAAISVVTTARCAGAPLCRLKSAVGELHRRWTLLHRHTAVIGAHSGQWALLAPDLVRNMKRKPILAPNRGFGNLRLPIATPEDKGFNAAS